MNGKIALCADTECLNDPGALGIAGENLLEQNWIVPFADALIARKYLKEHPMKETWVVSSNTVEGINLAAALKKDNRQNDIRLFVASPSGSNMSRCQNAGIEPIRGQREFANLYARRKQSFMRTPVVPREPVRYIAPKNNGGARTPSPSPATSPLPAPTPTPRVSVRRIERKPTGGTTPLPTIDIEEAPVLLQNEPPLVPCVSNTLHVAPSKAEPSGRNAFPKAKPVTESKPLEQPRMNTTVASGEKSAFVISVVSGSGGSGKSSISALTALLAQRKGAKTLILDADFQFGDLKYLLGYKQTLDVGDVLSHPEQIETLLKADTWPLLLAAPLQLEYSEVAACRTAELIGYLRPHFDVIVVNTGAFWSDLQAQLLELSNQVFFVIDQRPSSVRGCTHALDLCSRCGIATTSFSYLLNFCSKKALLSPLDVSCALKGVKVHEIRDGGSEVSELLGAGMAQKLSKINNPFCSSMDRLLKDTVYPKLSASLQHSSEESNLKHRENSARPKMRGRQKRRAACF